MNIALRRILVWCVILFTCNIYGAVIIKGDDSFAPNGFTAPVTTMVIKESTGTIFVGVDAPDNNAYAISKAPRPDFTSTPKFTGIATDMSFPMNASIEFLALSNQVNCKCILPFVLENMSTPFTSPFVAVIFENGDSYTQSDSLFDAAGAGTTEGIVQIATNSSCIFAAVRPNSGDFGDANSGIALIDIACKKLGSSETLHLTVKDATTGLDGNIAQTLDFETPQLTDGIKNVSFLTDDNDINQVALYWDDVFERLYIGVRIETDTSDIAKAVVVGRINMGLMLQDIVDNNAIIDGANNEIVVAQDTMATTTVMAKHIRVMHASTGPSYLIVNGGNGPSDTVCNKIYALPLVDDPTNPSIHGTLARKDAPLTNFKFTVPATAPGDLVTNTEPPALVGACISGLPILPQEQISDIHVVGDAVYVSITKYNGFASIGSLGIWYSQAEFDETGKIVRWTPWVRRASPFNAFPGVQLPCNMMDNGSVKLFEVDAKTGNIYLLEGTTDRVVGATSWATQSVANSLVNSLNTKLADGSYAALDLHQATRGFLDATVHRYALFGGVNKVVFVRTSEANDVADECSQQTVITNFSTEQNCLETPLPGDGGCVTVLEYARATDEGDQNYFFAGTANGLFVFADSNGNGFNVNTLDMLDQPPFAGGQWFHIDTIKGAIVDLQIEGKSLYVVTYELDCTQYPPMTSKVLVIPLQDTIDAMFDTGNIYTVAQTGIAPFADHLYFSGIQIIATGDKASDALAPEKEQLVLTTNQGVYVSDADQSVANTGIPEATSIADANWQLVADTNTTMYSNIFGMETPIKHTTWPASVEDEKCQICDRSSIHQFNSSGSATDTFAYAFVPEFFNAQDNTLPAFKTLDPINFFFSDGGRRFFIFNRVCDPSTQNKMGIIPFDTLAWNLQKPTVLSHPILNTIERFFWISPIGATGIILAGINTGVVGLL